MKTFWIGKAEQRCKSLACPQCHPAYIGVASFGGRGYYFSLVSLLWDTQEGAENLSRVVGPVKVWVGATPRHLTPTLIGNTATPSGDKFLLPSSRPCHTYIPIYLLCKIHAQWDNGRNDQEQGSKKLKCLPILEIRQSFLFPLQMLLEGQGGLWMSALSL